MFLKRLEIQGFKSFANRTEFLFDSGVTAMVGPNGAGKSNIADAVRWALGEQSPRALRIKRTEDVIFGGSPSRTRLGMAEVSLTFDNSNARFPLDFYEVTITRRAYRSGDNEYFLNRSKIRLRDLQDLLLAANIGQNAYTVIGQGTIDAALSLRPEERRGLFEEAADIKQYQVKRAEALEKLAATEANLLRIGDLLAEIGPRLQVLKEQAERARQHATLVGELRGYLIIWYRHLWRQAQEALGAAQAKEARARSALSAIKAQVEECALRLNQLRDEERAKRTALSEWHRQASILHAQAEALEPKLAVEQERARQLAQQQQELAQEMASLEAALQSEEAILAAMEQESAEIEARLQEQHRQVQSLEAELAAHEEERKRRQQELMAAQELSLQLASALADGQQRLTALAERRQELERACQEHSQAAAAATDRAEALRTKLAALTASLATMETEEQSLAQERQRLQSALLQAQARQNNLQSLLYEKQQRYHTAKTRLELLSRLQQGGEGYSTGVRAVLAAAAGAATMGYNVGDARRAERPPLRGVIGTLASLLQVPPELEVAIEVAMGGHLQDIVVETWDDAAAAIAFLRETKAGRCTFWPLQSIRQPRPSLPPLPTVKGIIGLALDLVKFQERYRGIFSHLLGNIVIVQDLETARHVTIPWATLVTLSGEIVRPAGSITGGSGGRTTGGVLAREREVRELPAQIAALEQECLQVQAALSQERLRGQQITAQIVALENRQKEQAAKRAAQATEEMTCRQQMAQAEQEAKWHQALQQQAQAELAAMQTKVEETQAGMAISQERYQAVQELLATLQRQITALEAAPWQARLADARAAVLVTEQSLRDRQALLASRQAGRDRLAAQVAAKRQRLQELLVQAKGLDQTIAATQARLAELRAQIAAVQEAISPTEAELSKLEAAQADLMAQEEGLQRKLLEAEQAVAVAGIEVTKAQEDLLKLQGQIEAEEMLRLSLPSEEGEVTTIQEALSDLTAWPRQLRLDLNGAQGQISPLTQITAATVTPEQARRMIDRLRGQIRSLGVVNPNAIQEYEEAHQRYAFLSAQADDLHRASKSLKAVVAELDAAMKKRFTETFRAVAEEFKQYFTSLFGGGTARLVLTDPDDPLMTGVDVVAQPPGKRLQSLALLSGGERALAAAALLFAILKVSRTPFCILDEVDAALDEANIGRFCHALRGLAQSTQFVVITHNRGTMEIADALYGVSMGEDGVSKVISLKLEGAQPFAS